MSLPPLPDQVRADMFLHLAVMERSGLPPDQAFKLLNLPAALAGRVNVARRLLGKGEDIPAAGFKSGLFSELETNILRAACSAGSPEITYKRLATRCAHRSRSAALVRSRMAMPLLTLLIALAVQPLPALVAGTITATGYVLSIVQPFLVLGGTVFLFRMIAKRLTTITNRPDALQVQLSELLIRVPLFGVMVVRMNVRDFYENLALMLEAGLPMLDALPLAVKTVGLYNVRADFARIVPLMNHGATLEQSLSGLRFQGRYPVLSFVSTGESSGTLPEMLQRFADTESETLTRFQIQLADWLPRLFYAGVAAWMAYQILNQHIF